MPIYLVEFFPDLRPDFRDGPRGRHDKFEVQARTHIDAKRMVADRHPTVYQGREFFVRNIRFVEEKDRLQLSLDIDGILKVPRP